MNNHAATILIGLCLLACTPDAIAQTTTPTDSDPTRPILFSVRPEFYRITGDVDRMVLISRYDAATLRNRRWLGGSRSMLLRLELPIATAHGAGENESAGLGDGYGQVLLVPRRSERFAYVVGTGLFVPTATDELLGSGKWILAPVAAPVWFLNRSGLMYVKFQNFISIAGDHRRPDVNYLLITPTLIHKVGRTSWILMDSETKTDWRRDRRTGVKSGIQIGHIVVRGFGLWVKPELWWGQNRDGRWNLKTGFVWYR